MITLLHEQSETPCVSAHVKSEELWLGAQELEAATGWSMKPEGLCRGDVCLPLPPDKTAHHVDGDRVNVSAFWHRMGNALLHDTAREVWVLGAGSAERRKSLQSLEAPDFTLPDLSGTPRSLSEQRGKKVLLVTWASW